MLKVKNKINFVLLCALIAPSINLNAGWSDSQWFTPLCALGTIATAVGGYFGYQWYYKPENVRKRKHNSFLSSAANGDLGAVKAGLLDQDIRESLEVGNSYQQTALALASKAGSQNVVEELLNAGARVDSQSVNQVSSLHYAVRSNSQGIVQRLIRAGAQVDAQTRGGSTALHYAVSGGNQAITQQLLGANADINKQNNAGCTALHLAAWNGHQGITEKLLQSIEAPDAKATFINMSDNNGSTALHYSTQQGYNAISDMLIKAGGDSAKRNNQGHTPQEARDAAVRKTAYNQGANDNAMATLAAQLAVQTGIHIAEQRQRERDREEARRGR